MGTINTLRTILIEERRQLVTLGFAIIVFLMTLVALQIHEGGSILNRVADSSGASLDRVASKGPSSERISASKGPSAERVTDSNGKVLAFNGKVLAAANSIVPANP